MKILYLYLTRSCQYLSNDVLFAWFLGGLQFPIVYSSGVIMMSHDNFMEIFVTEEKAPILDRAKLKLNVLILRILSTVICMGAEFNEPELLI